MISVNNDDPEKEGGFFNFRLYISGDTEGSQRIRNQLEKIFKQFLGMKFCMECIDLLIAPQRAATDGILATPTLVKLNPPVKKLFGDFSDGEKVFARLGIDIGN